MTVSTQQIYVVLTSNLIHWAIKIIWNKAYKFSLYFTGYKQFLSYKDQPVKAIREVIAVYSEDCGKHITTLHGKHV